MLYAQYVTNKTEHFSSLKADVSNRLARSVVVAIATLYYC